MANEAEALDGAESHGFLRSMTGLGRTVRPGSSAVSPANDVERVAGRTVARADAGPSVLSVDVEMKGSIVSRGELHIHGTVEGNVRAATLTVCAGGTVKGDIVAETVVIAGVVEGRIFGRDVRLSAGAVVTGDIAHGTLGVDTAAVFEGAVKRYEDPITEAGR